MTDTSKNLRAIANCIDLAHSEDERRTLLAMAYKELGEALEGRAHAPVPGTVETHNKPFQGQIGGSPVEGQRNILHVDPVTGVKTISEPDGSITQE